jgi:hypothetical protein
MGFVVELVSRGGRVQERTVIDKPAATLGRAYDRDIILNDPYVDAHHLTILNSLDGLSVKIESAQGHTLIDKHTPSGELVPVASGTNIVVGKTHLRVLSTQHSVPPVLALKPMDRVFATLGRPAIALTLTLFFIGLAFTNQYFQTITDVPWSRWVMQLLTPLLMALGWTSMWALITRVTRGETRFFQHWLAVLLYLTISLVLDLIQLVVQFNVGHHLVVEVYEWVTSGLALALLFWLHLHLALRQSRIMRHASAQGIAWAIVAYGILSTQSFEREFKSYPEFESTLLPPGLLLRTPNSEEDFIAASEPLFKFSEDELLTKAERKR